MLVFAVCGFFRRRCATSKPSMRGIITSSSTRSGRSAPASLERLLAVAGHRDVVAGGAEVHLDEPRDIRIVVHDEDRLGHLARLPRAMAARPRGRRGRVGLRGRSPEAAISTVAPASTARCAFSILTPPSTSISTSRPRRSISPRTASSRGYTSGLSGWSGPAGPDAHQHQVVELVQVREDRLDRRLQVERQPDAQAPRRAPSRSPAPGSATASRWKLTMSRPASRELVEEASRARRPSGARAASRSVTGRSEATTTVPESDRRHEVPVHDVDMDDLGVRLDAA